LAQEKKKEEKKKGERVDTWESNFTSRTGAEQMSPRTKEKQRIMRLIKVSFNKF